LKEGEPMATTGSNIITDSLSVKRPGAADHPMHAYFAGPSTGNPAPGVVVVHEIFGLNQNIRDIAERFAAAGYAALAVDLFSTANRVICMARIFHGMLIRPLTNGVVGDLRAALDHLATLPGVDAGKLGVIGFCMGWHLCLAACLRRGSPCEPPPSSTGRIRARSKALVRLPSRGQLPERDFTASAARQLEPILSKPIRMTS
jgi:carboxymethylenebutenolidase